MAIIATVATDEKDREMVCLPPKFIYGWIFTINSGMSPGTEVPATSFFASFLKIIAEKFGYMEQNCYLCIVVNNIRSLIL